MPDSALSDGSYLTSSFYEAYIRPQVIVACTSSTRPTGVEGRRIYETDTDKEYTHDGSSWVEMGRVGAWTAYTPTLTQSVTVTKTVVASRYVRYGRTIHWTFALSITSTGTAGNQLTVTLPVTASASSTPIGHGYVYDSSAATIYNGTLLGTTTSLVLITDGATSGSAWGLNPNVAATTSDSFAGSITYEAAS